MQVFLSHISLRSRIRREGLTLADIPHLAAEHGFDGIEWADRALESLDRPRLQAFLRACRETGCGLVVDLDSDLTLFDDDAWRYEIARVRSALLRARDVEAVCARLAVGGQSLRLQSLLGSGRPGPGLRRSRPGRLRALRESRLLQRTGHALRRVLPPSVRRLEERIARAVRALQEIAPRAVRCEVPLAIENHWGITSRPEDLVRVVRAVRSPHVGTCPDLANFPRDVDPYDALEQLAPHARLVHARSARFRGDGEESRLDYRRCLEILRGAGYDGILTVEFTGRGDELRGALRTRELILRHW